MNSERKAVIPLIAAILYLAATLCAHAFTMVLSVGKTDGLYASGAHISEGSVVMIFGSADSTPNMPLSDGSNYIASSVTGDDVYIGCTRVLEGGYIGAGGLTYDSKRVNYLYLRFYDTTNFPVTGFHAWGTTDVWGVTNLSPFPYVEVDFAPAHGYNAGHTNNFSSNKVADVSLTKRGVPVPESPAKWSIPISKGAQFSDGDYWLRLETGKPSFDVWGPGNLKSTNVLDANWHHVVGRFTRGTNDAWGTHKMEILVDGVVVASKLGRGATDVSDAPLYLGAYMGNSGFYAGLMDEIRLSRGLRNDAWLKATHTQQSDPAAFLSVGPEQAGTRPGYAHQRTLTIHGALVTGELTDFPALVSLTAPFLRDGVAMANGADLLFTTAGGQELAREVELFTKPAGRLVAWVKVPSVAAGSDTAFVLHYGNPAPAAPAFPPAAVWNDGFMMVQHLEEGAGPVLDSTAHGNNGVVSGAQPSAFGSANGAYLFDGKNDVIAIPNDPSLLLNTGDFTMEGWFARKAMPADVMFEITVRNAGPDEALNVEVEDVLTPNFTLVKTLATQGFYALPPGLWDVGDLMAGGSATLQLSAKLTGLSMATNVAEVVACDSADPDSTPGNHQAGEDDQASAIGMVSVGGGSPGKPDFSVESVSFMPVTLTPDTVFTAVVTVINRGAVPGNAGELRVWANRSTAANPGEAGDASYTVGLLAVGESRQVTFTNLRAPATNGSYKFRAFVDANNGTVETSEGNNQKAVSYSFSAGYQPKPDFSVTSVSFMPAVLTPDTAFTALVTVVNGSAVAANAGLLKVWANRSATANPGDPSDATQTVGALAAGESRVLTFAGLRTPATNGAYKFRAFVDANNAVTETSEGNNQKTVSYSFSTVYQPKPDFSVTGVLFVPATLTPAIAFTAMVTVVNNGAVAADAGLLKVWANRSATAYPGDPSDESRAVGILAAGESRVFTFTNLRAPATNGTYKFRAFVDADNTAIETSEGNNQKTVSYSFSSGYQPKPDFLITAIGFSPVNPARGAPFTAYVTVKNQSSLAANAGYMDVWVSKSASARPGEAGDAWQGVGTLNATQSVQLVFSGLTAPTNGTKHTFRGFVDSHGTVVETSEGNNQSTRAYSF